MITNQQIKNQQVESSLARWSIAMLSLFSSIAWASPTVSRFNGGFDDVSSAMTTDAMGNVFVAAAVESTERKREFAVIKYDANGTVRWTAAYSNASHSADGGAAISVALDAAGNVYAVGMIYKQVTLFIANVDWLVVSYTPEGIERWSQRIDGTAHDRDFASSVVVDAIGDVHVSGTVIDTELAGQAGWTLIKYSSSGVPLWRRTDSRNDGTRDALGCARLDSAGNLVCTGMNSSVQPSMQRDIVTAKVTASGNLLWRSTFTETAQSDEIVTDMTLDAFGNIYVTGETVPSTNPELVHVPFTLKYNGAGNLLFALRGDGAGGSSIAVDGVGDVVVSGTSFREGGQIGLAATAKYDGNGVRRWLTSGVSGQVAVDSLGNSYVFVAVQTFTSNRSDVDTAKLNSDGVRVWTHRYNGQLTANGSADWAIASTVDAFDNFVALVTADDSGQEDFILLRYAANVTPDAAPTTINAPTNVSANAFVGRIQIAWADNSNNEAAFSIERCVGKTCTNFAAIAQVAANTTSFSDSNVSTRTAYRYRLRANNGTLFSSFSNIATVTTGKK